MEYNRKLARFYNKYWTGFAPELFDEVLRKYFLSELPSNAEILDLCCGTGQVCAILTKSGYDVMGIDLSYEMLTHARVNAPNASFVQADARYFKLDTKFDAVVSFFDSINHLLTVNDLLECFKSVKQALKPDGQFLFDVNDIEIFTDSWEDGFAEIEADNACIFKPIFEPKTGIAEYNITMFEKADNNTWQREDVVVHEQYYPPKKIVETLFKAGFINIKIFDGGKDFNIEAFIGRKFFICQ